MTLAHLVLPFALAALTLGGRANDEVPRGVREGVVILDCQVQADGRISDCSVVSETPPGMGFAEAAIRATRRARLNRREVARAVDGRVRFTTRFRLE